MKTKKLRIILNKCKDYIHNFKHKESNLKINFLLFILKNFTIKFYLHLHKEKKLTGKMIFL